MQQHIYLSLYSCDFLPQLCTRAPVKHSCQLIKFKYRERIRQKLADLHTESAMTFQQRQLFKTHLKTVQDKNKKVGCRIRGGHPPWDQPWECRLDQTLYTVDQEENWKHGCWIRGRHPAWELPWDCWLVGIIKEFQRWYKKNLDSFEWALPYGWKYWKIMPLNMNWLISFHADASDVGAAHGLGVRGCDSLCGFSPGYKTQTTARCCANNYELHLADNFQRALDTGNIKSKFKGIKQAAGEPIQKIAPLKSRQKK